MDGKHITQIFKALSDENRMKIIEMLAPGERCGCELLCELEITQPTLSHHMKILEDCGLVTSYKEGKWHYYSLVKDTYDDICLYLNKLTTQPMPKYRKWPEGCCQEK